MALLEKFVYVKKSTLEGAGKGLFCKKAILKGTRIIEYKGKITTWKEVDSQDGDNGYIYYVKKNHVIDASHSAIAMARYANDARGMVKVNGITNNAQYREEGTRVYIVSTKDIPTGAEIFVEYGKEYWQVIRHNIKIDSQREKLKQNGSERKK